MLHGPDSSLVDSPTAPTCALLRLTRQLVGLNKELVANLHGDPGADPGVHSLVLLLRYPRWVGRFGLVMNPSSLLALGSRKGCGGGKLRTLLFESFRKIGPVSTGRGKRSINRGARDFKQVSNATAVVLSLVDQLAGVVELLRREFQLAAEFHASALRVLYARARAFADKAALKLGQEAGPTGRRVGVDVLRKRTEFNPSLFEFVEHTYQVAQAAA